MRKITIWLLNYQIKKAEKRKASIDTDYIIRAYDVMINNYKNSIMFLKANKIK